MKRRRLLVTCSLPVLFGLSGCLDTLSGGRISGGADPTQLTAQRGEIVELYDEAITERNDGVRTRDDAILAFNDESYEKAVGKFEVAIEHFEGAKQRFEEAASMAYELGEDEAGSICEAAEEDAALQIEASRAGLNAAKAANGDGTSADVNGHVEEYRDLLERAKDIPVEEPQTLADVIQSG
jgi:hypothetical protein